MTATLDDGADTSLWRKFGQTGLLYTAAWIASIWLIELVDTVFLGERLQRQGIQPRSLSGLDGVFWAPFLHSTFGHLLSNTAPFAVLGGLVALRGRGYWLTVTILSIVVGGTLTWVFARNGNHIGSSGVVFGYLGALLGAAAFERRIAYIAPAVIAVFFYGTIFVGLVPQNDVSWEGHLAGLLAGALAAFWLSKTRSELRTARQEPVDDYSHLFDEADFLADLDDDDMQA